MAVSPEWTNNSPGQFNDTDGSNPITFVTGAGAPDGDAEPQTSAAKGSIYWRNDATDDCSPVYLKVDDEGSDDDWVAVLVANGEGTVTIEANWLWDTSDRIQFRDSAIYVYSPSDGKLRLVADTQVEVGDGTNQSVFAADGQLTMDGTAKVTRIVPLEISTGGGTCDIAAWNDGPTINLDADGEIFYASFVVPQDWDAASDLYWKALIGNEIAEDDGDDISLTLQVAGYADGEAAGAAGQSVAVALNLTGGDEAINVINLASGTIDYNEATYPMARGDIVQIKATVNLGDGTECTGPLHITAHYIQYTSDRLGLAT